MLARAAPISLSLAALAMLAAGCAGERRERCDVTAPRGPIHTAIGGFNYGSRALAVQLWPDGELVAGTLADGSSWARVAADGSIDAKLGWWRGAPGRLRIAGRRLDAAARPVSANIPLGYGPRGFQATRVSFPGTGCYRVVASAGRARLSFVVRVRQR
jgi:hypothetical protein